MHSSKNPSAPRTVRRVNFEIYLYNINVITRKDNKMKALKIIALLLAAVTALSVAFGCAPAPEETAKTTETEAETAEETEAVTTEAETTEAETEAETYDPSLDISALEKDENGNIVNVKAPDPTLLVATDGLGREVVTNEKTGGVRENKTVGIFYSPWHGEFAGSVQAVNNQEILDEFPDIDINNFNDKRWKTANYHFWNEPIYGYYSGDDEWVIRRQAELLADAGVDCVICDNTNGSFTWLTTAKKMMKVFHEAREDGVKAPTVAFMLPFGPTDGALSQLKELYKNIYKPEYYPDSWLIWDEKPLILAFKTVLKTSDETQKEIAKFFTFRQPQPDYLAKQSAPKQWGWLAVYPQPSYGVRINDKEREEITVGVAQNHNWKTHTITAMNGENVTDRTYTSKGYDTRENAELYGANFAEQFEYALTVDPKFIFITGWNEWVAIRQKSWPPASGSTKAISNAFADQFSDLASRDIEPTKGRLKDHYYYQMVSYIRQYKGTNPIPEASAPKKIDIYGGFGQWADVLPEFNSYAGNTGKRSALGYCDPKNGARIRYKDESGRNDIYDAKVSRDNENVYFMVRCTDDITPYTDDNWMRLYIDVSDSDKSWETFEFVLNKTKPVSAGKAVLDAFTGDGFNTVKAGEAEYNVSGNVLTVKIPRSMLGIGEGGFTLDFKWADNSFDGDIMDVYTLGDAAPGGRFKFRYTAK